MTDDTYESFLAEYNRRIDEAAKAISADWALTGYRGHNTLNGVAWTARLRRNGKIVAIVEEAGRGGDTLVAFKGGWRDPAATDWATAVSNAAGSDERIALEALLRRAGK